jgi:shikimate dehydrogenase
MRAMGLRGAYLPYRTSPGDVPRALDDLVSAEAVGCNVTVPLKLEAADSVDTLGEGARRSGAVNTIVFTDGGSTRGENTDADGVRITAGELLDKDGHGLTALVLGTGGAARGAVAGLVDWGAQVAVTGRSEDKLEALCADMAGHARPVGPDGLGTIAGMVDLLVQATSQGMRGVPPEGPLTPAKLIPLVAPKAVLDMVYARGGTHLVRTARDLGIPAAGGERVLLHQAVEGFRLWSGKDPPVAEMERALTTALG